MRQEPQPADAAVVRPRVRVVSPTTLSPPLSRSIRPWPRASARRERHSPIPAARAIGALISSAHRHPQESVSTPPSSTPMPEPEPMMVPNTPNALTRSVPSGNVSDNNASADGVTSAPKTPWVARAAMSISGETASPPAIEARVNPISPINRARRRPITSETRPPSSSRDPNAST